MIKTTYQKPELRDANDNIIQEGAFGKNSPLTNATNDGALDYILNNLEALHDTIGDSAPTLDGNGHVVEPANLAIGDEDGLRIKNSYLKLSGGNVTGVTSFRSDLRMLDNQDNRFGGLYVPGTTATEQYMQLYGGTRAVGDARLTLYPSSDGHFSLLAYSNDGSNSYELRNDNAGNLNWRGYPLAWKKDYLALAGGTMTGNLTFNRTDARISNSSGDAGLLSVYGGSSYANGAYLSLTGANYGNAGGRFSLIANDGTKSVILNGRPDGTLAWGGKNIFYGDNNINATYKDGYEINRSNNTLRQWRRQSINAGSSYTWTFAKPFDSNVYIILIWGNNGNVNFTIAQTETSATITNNGNVQTLVNMLAIGISAS